MTRSQAYSLSEPARRYFRDDLRNARSAASLDAEGFSAIVFAIERLGAHLLPGQVGLGAYKEALRTFASRSSVEISPAGQDLRWHIPYERLFELVRNGRNDALHQGASARSLTEHAVQLALLVEEGLMAEDHRIGDFMVRDIAVAHPWQPVSSVRQAMLVNSFTFLPTPVTTLGAPAWHLISDYQLARFLRPNDSSGHEDRHERSRRPSMSIETAIREAGLMVDKAVICRSTDTVANVLSAGEERLYVVVDNDDAERIVGVISPYDML